MGDGKLSKWVGRERDWNHGDQEGLCYSFNLLYLTVLCGVRQSFSVACSFGFML